MSKPNQAAQMICCTEACVQNVQSYAIRLTLTIQTAQIIYKEIQIHVLLEFLVNYAHQRVSSDYRLPRLARMFPSVPMIAALPMTMEVTTIQPKWCSK